MNSRMEYAELDGMDFHDLALASKPNVTKSKENARCCGEKHADKGL